MACGMRYTLVINVLFLPHRRIREKYEAELREVERSEKGVLEKFGAMKVCRLATNPSLCCRLVGHTRRGMQSWKETAPGYVHCSGRRSMRWTRSTQLCRG